MKRFVHDRTTVDMLHAFEKRLEEFKEVESNSNILGEDEYDSPYVYLDSKDVKDSDGFWTTYTLYKYVPEDTYVTVFGDPDIYRPEDGNFDAEFDDESEAYEWFELYHGFDGEEEEEEYDGLLGW